MKYRKFGKLDWQVSALSFGAMRLPILNEDYAKIDEAQAIPMIRYAVDHGGKLHRFGLGLSPGLQRSCGRESAAGRLPRKSESGH